MNKKISKKHKKAILYDIIDEWVEERNLDMFVVSKDIKDLIKRIMDFLTPHRPGAFELRCLGRATALMLSGITKGGSGNQMITGVVLFL